jgi:sugar O-acyltransferase (sialic acid O-acetyltransferase NeuD family)
MEQRKQRIAVFGAGGHGKVVADAIQCNPALDLVCVLDDKPQAGATILGWPVAGGREALLARRGDIDGVIIAIGDNRARLEVAGWIASQGLILRSVVHPAAVVAPSATIGAGALIMPGAVVNAEARIGANAIVNSGAVVEHDCEVEEAVHIAPGAVLCGGARIGAGALIGAGAVVLPGVRVGAWLLLKAGTVAARDVEKNG